MKLEGIGVMVDDMAVMVRFYRDVLGILLIQRAT
jgi:catechol 2,3-dioxygenase-like lactoylglutathione lyase family enzyme